MTATDVNPGQSGLPSVSPPCCGRRGTRAATFFAALVLAPISVPALAASPTSAPATSPVPAALLGTPPQTPGFHHLYYAGQLNGKPRRLAYSVYLPRNYSSALTAQPFSNASSAPPQLTRPPRPAPRPRMRARGPMPGSTSTWTSPPWPASKSISNSSTPPSALRTPRPIGAVLNSRQSYRVRG